RRGERLIAAEPKTPWVSDRVLAKEAAPEQLRIGHREWQRRGVQVDVVVRVSEDGLGNPPPVHADHPAGDDIGAMLVGDRYQPYERLRPQIVVRADEEHVPTGRVGEATVAGRRGSATVVLVNHAERVGVPPGKTIEHSATAVGRPVVDGDD